MHIQNGAPAPAGSACLEKAIALAFTARQLAQIHAAGSALGKATPDWGNPAQIHAAGSASRRLLAIRATAPEWPQAYAEWQHLAENVAAAVIAHMEAQGARHD